MASLKRSYTKTTLLDLSAKIMDRLEETFEFMEFYTLRKDIDKMPASFVHCTIPCHPRRSADCRTDRKMVPEKEIIAPSYKRE